MPSSFGFAIVGCGMIARYHARAIAVIPGAHVAALVSRTPEGGLSLIEETGIPACPVLSSVAEAVAEPGVDAVIVTTPSGAHLEPAIVAAAAGKHVIVEKPLEITAERCDRIIAACERHGVRLATIFPARFGDANLALKLAIEAGRFGRITFGEAGCKWWRDQKYYDEGGWKGTAALDGGGALMNQAIHAVDLLLWTMGPAVWVSGFAATLAHERIEVEDTAAAVVRFASGALGAIRATTSIKPGYPRTIAVHGDRGSAEIAQDDVVVWDFDIPLDSDLAIRQAIGKPPARSGGSADPKTINHEGHRRQLADFIAALREGRPPRVDGREGRRSVELIEAIYRSNASGQAVELGRF